MPKIVGVHIFFHSPTIVLTKQEFVANQSFICFNWPILAPFHANYFDNLLIKGCFLNSQHMSRFAKNSNLVYPPFVWNSKGIRKQMFSHWGVKWLLQNLLEPKILTFCDYFSNYANFWISNLTLLKANSISWHLNHLWNCSVLDLNLWLDFATKMNQPYSDFWTFLKLPISF